jgi:MYXO-CTERM domain-containing protein
MNPTNDIHDIKGVVPVPHSWWWLAGLVLLLVLAFVWWRRRRRSSTVAAPVILPSPFELALAALRRLREDGPPVEQFYTRLSDIVRQYIESQFGLRAPERTTEEFLAEATLPAQHMTLLSSFLQESDLVKFARLRPGNNDMERAFAAAEKFVRESQS